MLRRRLPSPTRTTLAPSALEKAGIRGMDVVVAATRDDEDNIVVANLAKYEFEVPHVVGRVKNALNTWLYEPDIGVDMVVSAPHTIAQLCRGCSAEPRAALAHHGCVYSILNRVLVEVNGSGQNWFFYWPLLGWGIAVLLNRFLVFSADRFFGPDWEKRKIREEIAKQR